MRPLLAIGVILVALGSVKAYITFVDSITGRLFTQTLEVQAEGRFRVDLTISFDARANAFNPQSVLLTLHGGRTLLQREKPVPAGTVLSTDIPLSWIVEGANEFYFKVATGEAEIEDNAAFSLSGEDPVPESNPQGDLEGADKSRAVRIRVFRDGQLVDEETFWSEPGLAVEDTMTVILPAGSTAAQDQHQEHAEKGPS
jgi:hypothetical protein